jgi:outer membrane protein
MGWDRIAVHRACLGAAVPSGEVMIANAVECLDAQIRDRVGSARHRGLARHLLKVSLRLWLGCVWMAATLIAKDACAEHEPLWEIGFGGGVLSIPEYRGAGQSHVYGYPFVLPFYRGSVLRSDEQGIRGLFFTSDRVKLDVSLDGSVPVGSGQDPARAGMSDLAPTVQIGPMLRYLLWGHANDRMQSLSLDLPVRAAFAIQSDVRHIGYTAYPSITYRQDLRLGSQAWQPRLSGGPMWGSKAYNSYFYQVPRQNAIPGRPAYDADAGYGGLRLLSTLYHRQGNLLVSFYAVFDSVKGAVFHDSPLVQRDNGLTVGFLLSWFLVRSRQTVETTGFDW